MFPTWHRQGVDHIPTERLGTRCWSRERCHLGNQRRCQFRRRGLCAMVFPRSEDFWNAGSSGILVGDSCRVSAYANAVFGTICNTRSFCTSAVLGMRTASFGGLDDLVVPVAPAVR